MPPDRKGLSGDDAAAVTVAGYLAVRALLLLMQKAVGRAEVFDATLVAADDHAIGAEVHLMEASGLGGAKAFAAVPFARAGAHLVLVVRYLLGEENFTTPEAAFYEALRTVVL